jgi:hypothetical protein
MKGTAVVNRREHPTKLSARSFSGTNDDGRTFSSMPPHHLALKNNGMVNGLVKSTKVPRPIVAMPPPTRSRNQLKERAVLLVIPEKEEEEAGGERQGHISYVGNDSMPITTELKIVLPEDDVPRGTWPVFRMMVSERGDLSTFGFELIFICVFFHDQIPLSRIVINNTVASFSSCYCFSG